MEDGMKSKIICMALLFSTLILLFSSFVSAEDKLSVYTVNYPLHYFTERIGGEHVRVVFPAPASVDSAYWKPDQETISAYQKADLIVLNGAGYAKWVGMVSLPRSKTVNTTAGLKDRYIHIQGNLTHSHGPAGEHAHEAIAFTTWLDFDLASWQALAIYKALCVKLPELKEVFTANYKLLKKELVALDREMKTIVEKNPQQPLVGSHPVYQYLAHRYGMQFESVHWEQGEVPNSQQWKNLQDILKTHSAKWMLWEGKPLPKTASRLSGEGLSSTVFDPFGNRPDHGNFMSSMHQNIANLKRAYQ
jgi:zinc transport system substrate-binding protein